ncbi:MAG: hypothetical protein JO227_06705 [Acetobacteraceae bacterium]|nr:hypothetical protein [Acetobacteraceae bacterium]
MRRTTKIAAAGLLAGGLISGTLVAYAQPAPPSDPAEMEGGWGRGQHSRMMDWMRRFHEGREGRGPVAPGTFALVYRQADKQLTPADVQKIAEAFLLWNGNHTWKVVDVAPASDGAIGFALATQDGSVVARFTIDSHSGRVTRTS